MILVDSNVLINFWKSPVKKDYEILSNNEIATCGIISTELLRGAKTDKEFEQIQNVLDSFNYLPFEELDWPKLAKFFITLRNTGISVPFQDGMISYLAIKNNCKIWTNDNHFKLVKKAHKNLKLLSA